MPDDARSAPPSSTPPKRVDRSDAEWKELLPEEVHRIARQRGTERAFTGRFWNEKRPGIYRCACCGTELFASEDKYDSGTGWPSFRDVVDPGHVAEREDHSFAMKRIEAVCAACDAHLGHLFPDGPAPTGLRYCVNSASLTFEPTGEG